MALSARLELITLAVALATACGQTSSESNDTDASSDASNPADAKGEAGPVDPNCHDGDVLWDLPTGSCVEGASCEIQRKSKCPDGTVLVYPAIWACACQGGTWSCENIGGGLNLPMCPDAGTTGACSSKACGEYCDTCEWGACSGGDAAPHELQCNAAGKCQYISMTDTPPACVGPIQCGDASCGNGFSCHCMFNAAKRCCPLGTECEPCQ